MKILSLGGAGAVCRHVTRDLAEYSDFDQIVIGEYNLPAAEELTGGAVEDELAEVHAHRVLSGSAGRPDFVPEDARS